MTLHKDEFEIHVLPNGFTVALEYLPYLRSASYGIWIKAGSAAEKAAKAGTAHFLEHLFFKGTKTRTAHDLMEAIEAKGGDFNAATSREYTNLYLRMLEHHVEAGMDVLADVLLNSTFCDFEKERGIILEEIASTADTPDEMAYDLLTEHHWPAHALGRPVSGYMETVKSLEKRDISRFYRTACKAGNMVFAISGNFDRKRVLKQARTLFSGIPAGDGPPMDSVPKFSSGKKRVFRSLSQVHICLAFPGPSASGEERYVSGLTAGILGGGATSRLFERIREQDGLAYNVYAYTANYIPSGMLGIYEVVAPENCRQALKATFEESNRLREELVPPEQLDRVREQLKGSILMSLEGTYTRVSRMAKGLMFRGRIAPVEEVIDGFHAVTPEHVRDYARKYFCRESCAMLLLGPRKYTDGEIAL